jgi:transposase
VGRTQTEITTLHGYSFEELIDIKNTTESKYTALVLTIITMRYKGYSNDQIIEITGLSKVAIISHIKKWNSFGFKAAEDHRGGNKPPILSPDMVDNLLYVVVHKTPADFDLPSYSWTLALMVSYIKQTYDVDISQSSIRTTLIDNNFSYKRAQPMPSKADKTEQENFKKNVGSTKLFRVFT